MKPLASIIWFLSGTIIGAALAILLSGCTTTTSQTKTSEPPMLPGMSRAVLTYKPDTLSAVTVPATSTCWKVILRWSPIGTNNGWIVCESTNIQTWQTNATFINTNRAIVNRYVTNTVYSSNNVAFFKVLAY